MGRKGGRQRREAAPGTSEATDELAAAVAGEIRRSSVLVAEQAERLESIGAQSFEIAAEIFRDATAQELTRRSHALRGVVAHALVVVAELADASGRLGALAALRAAEEAAEDDAPKEGSPALPR